MFINEPRLSDFKQVLLREGIQAEFVGGVLVCNNMVAVRRVSVLPPDSLSVISISTMSLQQGSWPAQKTMAMACFFGQNHVITMQHFCFYI